MFIMFTFYTNTDIQDLKRVTRRNRDLNKRKMIFKVNVLRNTSSDGKEFNDESRTCGVKFIKCIILVSKFDIIPIWPSMII